MGFNRKCKICVKRLNDNKSVTESVEAPVHVETRRLHRTKSSSRHGILCVCRPTTVFHSSHHRCSSHRKQEFHLLLETLQTTIFLQTPNLYQRSCRVDVWRPSVTSGPVLVSRQPSLAEMDRRKTEVETLKPL